jgi:3-methyladenine DNA glycosylase AlkD
MIFAKLKSDLQKRCNSNKAKILQGFFKTGPGEYAEGDIFLGISVPILRNLAKQHQHLTLSEIQRLLKSRFHEERLLALLILILKYRAANESGKEKIYRIYLAHTKHINNWDLVDVSAKHIVGDYLMNFGKKPLTVLTDLAQSKYLWERRIAILSTFRWIDHNRFDATLRIARILLADSHDLIHKAVGWMLREVGKKSMSSEEKFLKKYCRIMPRTMLRYAIERFPSAKRRAYLQGISGG